MAHYEVRCDMCQMAHSVSPYEVMRIVTTCSWCGGDLCPNCGQQEKGHEDCLTAQREAEEADGD